MASLQDILTADVLAYAHQRIFIWPVDKRLDGREVGRQIFSDGWDARPGWTTAEVRSALQQLSKLELSTISGPDLLEVALNAPPKPLSTLQSWERIVGLTLLIDQGPRYNCHAGTNQRYVYDFFGVLAQRVLKHLVEQKHPILTLSGWEKQCNLNADQSAARILMLQAPLVHSELLTDQKLHLAITEDLRKGYEQATQTRDPHRATFDADEYDLTLFGRYLSGGPPKGEGVTMPDFVYWMMRIFTAHVSYVRHFGDRSPFQNVAVGRADKEGEREWLEAKFPGMVWTEEDEETRAKIREDVKNGRWTPLKFET